jgi:hypothetical protein
LCSVQQEMYSLRLEFFSASTTEAKVVDLATTESAFRQWASTPSDIDYAWSQVKIRFRSGFGDPLPEINQQLLLLAVSI